MKIKMYDYTTEKNQEYEEETIKVKDLITFLEAIPEDYEVGRISTKYSTRKTFERTDIEIIDEEKLVLL